jgi:predicted nuclease with TOPRIM domain
MGLDMIERDYHVFLQYLMKALTDDQVKETIQTICINNNKSEDKELSLKNDIDWEQQISALHQENNRIKEELRIERNKLTKERNKLSIVQRQLDEREEQYSKLLEELEQVQNNFDEVNKRFEPVMKMYHDYQSLSQSLKESLSGIFRGSQIEQFLFCGVQKPNIELLWDSIKIRAMDGNEEDIRVLVSIFTYFFEAYNSTFERPIYEMQPVMVNDKFDSEKHIRTRDSRVAGEVKQVVLRGYINKISKKIERKSIIKI